MSRHARPLIAIDPEDREQVERLVRAFWAANTDDGDDVDFMQAALRSLIADPKPVEPQGLGAVVEDADGERWVRRRIAGGDGNAWVPANALGFYNWPQITAVRVLNAGVTS